MKATSAVRFERAKDEMTVATLYAAGHRGTGTVPATAHHAGILL